MGLADIPSSRAINPDPVQNGRTIQSHKNTILLMMLALLDCLQVGANGMLAHAQQMNQMTQNLNSIDNEETAQHLAPIPSVIPGSHGTVSNQTAIMNAQTLNNEFIKQQSDQNLYANEIQQLLNIQTTSSDACNQALSNIVSQLTYSMQQMTSITFSAGLTTPPQAL